MPSLVRLPENILYRVLIGNRARLQHQPNYKAFLLPATPLSFFDAVFPLFDVGNVFKMQNCKLKFLQALPFFFPVIRKQSCLFYS
jgi:hypothetical protein